MKKLRKIDGSCAVCALWYVAGKDEDTVLRICKSHGFDPALGMGDDDWIEAADHLGIKVTSVSLSPQKLRRFVHDYPQGLFFVGTFDHLFVVDNGIIIDPRCAKPPGLDRTVRQAWRVK